MVVSDKNQPGKKKALTPEMPEKPLPYDPLDDLDPGIEEQLARAKTTRVQAESAREKISSEIMDASKRLYQTLLEEGEQALERAKKLEAAAELTMLESQRELQHSRSIRQEADTYLQKVIAQTREQSQEIIQQSQTVTADAVAFREKLLFEIKQQAELELEQAQSSRVEADAYRERVIAQTQRQANDTLDRARLTAEQEGSEIKQRHAMEAQKVLAQADLIKAAAEEQLEAQRIYSDAAIWQSEAREVLDHARSMVNQESPLIGLISGHQPSGHQPSGHQPSGHQPSGHQPSGHQPSGHQTSDRERHLVTEDQPANCRATASSAGVTRDSYRFELVPEPKPSTSWSKDRFDPATGETAEVKGPGSTRPKAVNGQTPELPSANPDISGLLPANELVLGIESNHRCRAYPFSAISQQRIINDTVGELDILVAFGPPSELAMMFNRNLDGRSLMFETVSSPQNDIADIASMKDQETGSIWEALTGRAISGPLAGAELERLTSEYSFWFSWSQVHPTTDVYADCYTDGCTDGYPEV